MPKIPIYMNQLFPDASPLAQAAKGAESSGYYIGGMRRAGFNALGEGVQAAYKRLTEKSPEDKQKEQDELSNLSADSSTLQANLAVQWQQTLNSADPKDPNVATNFMDKVVKPQMDKFGADATTPRAIQYRQKETARVMSHLLVTTQADQVNLSKTAAVDNSQETLNGYTRQATTSPLDWQHQMDGWNGAVENLELPADIRLKTQREGNHAIAVASAEGVIEQNPNTAIDMIDKQVWGNALSGTEYESLKNKAQTAQHEKLVTDNATLDAKRKELGHQLDADVTQLNKSITLDDQGVFHIPPGYFDQLKQVEKKYSAAGYSDPDKFRVWGDWAAGVLKGDHHPQVSDRDTLMQLEQKQKDGSLTADDVVKASPHLSNDDFKGYYGSVGMNPADKEARSGAVELIDGFHDLIAGKAGFFGVSDPGGEARFKLAKSALLKVWQQMYDSGLRGDKLDSTFQDYVINNQGVFVNKFKMGDVLHPQPVVPFNAPAWQTKPVEPIQPGESPADYLKRIGK